MMHLDIPGADELNQRIEPDEILTEQIAQVEGAFLGMNPVKNTDTRTLSLSMRVPVHDKLIELLLEKGYKCAVRTVDEYTDSMDKKTTIRLVITAESTEITDTAFDAVPVEKSIDTDSGSGGSGRGGSIDVLGVLREIVSHSTLDNAPKRGLSSKLARWVARKAFSD
jgi:hypothetical protein